MGTKFLYAVVLTVATAVFNLILFSTGFQTEKLATGQHLAWLGVIIQGVVLWFGIKAVREEKPDKSLSYGRGLGAGVLISLYSGLMSAVYTYVHYKFINPDYTQYQLVLVKQKWSEAGMNAEQMDQAASIASKFMGPVFMSIMTPIGSVIMGTFLSLILAAILKRAPESAQPPQIPS